jgi:transposase-like protein/transposase
MSQKKIAELLGFHQSTISDWLIRYGVDKIAIKLDCLFCGKSFDGKERRSKYCSQSCSWKATYLKNHPVIKRMRVDPKLRLQGLELYWGGLDGFVIAAHLKVPLDTVYGWIHDFGHLKKRQRNPELMKLLPINLQVESARNPEEWKRVLHENAPVGDDAPVVIICGTRNGNSGINSLVTIVQDRLKRNPCDGVTYAFCSSRGEQVSTICWLREAFCLTKLPKSHGGYIWPDASVGKQIELRKSEFDFLLSLKKKRGPKPYFS